MYHGSLPNASTRLHHLFVIDADRLADLAGEAGLGPVSIVLTALDGKERPIYPASMIKVPIAVALALRCASGSLRWNQTVTVETHNLTTNDAPSPFAAGYEATLGELMRAALADSDNVATNVLIDVLGRESIGPACAPFGLRTTAVRRKLSGSLPLIDDPVATGRNAHPAADAARLFAAIARSDDPGLHAVYGALRGQRWNDKLSPGWRPGDGFAHKTGDTDEVSHDGGILTLENGRRFVLVVYTELPARPETEVRFSAFARALRPYLDD